MEHRPRADVLALLEPWLVDHGWTRLSPPYWLLGRLPEQPVPGMGPLLLRVAGRPAAHEDAYPGRDAWQTLVRWRDPAVVPFLRARLDVPRCEGAEAYVGALLQLTRPDDAALADFVIAASAGAAAGALAPRATARLAGVIDSVFREQSYLDLDPWCWIYGVLTRARRDGVAAYLVRRLREPGPLAPEALAKLRAQLVAWPCAPADRFLLDELGAGRTSAEDVLRLVQRREALRRDRREPLAQLAGLPGWRGGVATALLGDREAVERLAGARDVAGQRALIAVSRLAGEQLAFADVRALAARGAAVRGALEAYARDALSVPLDEVLAAPRHPWRLLGPPLDQPWKRTTADALAARMGEADAPDELFATVTGHRRGGEVATVTTAVEVRGTTVEVIYSPAGGRTIRRTLASSEAGDLLRFLRSRRSAPPRRRSGDAPGTVFVHMLGGTGGAFDLPTETGEHHAWAVGKIDYCSIYTCLQSLIRDDVSPPIDVSGKPGEVLLAPDPKLRAVWKDGDDLRVLRIDDEAHRGMWLAVRGAALAAERPQPAACPFLGRRGDSPRNPPRPDSLAWFSRHAASERQGDWNGVWCEIAGGELLRVVPTDASHAVVTPDGRHVAFRERMLIVYDVARHARLPVPGVEGRPIGATPDGLIVAARKGGGAVTLIDPATGRTSPATGQLAPYREDRWRPWQPTRNPGEVWVAIDGRVGRYDPRAFRFTETNRFPHLSFDSMDMWVDEDEGKLYAVAGGQLLRLPLR